jgi:hypothetical protein
MKMSASKALMALLAMTMAGCIDAQEPWSPVPGHTWQIQLQGKIDTSIPASVYIIDLFDAPQAVIDALHARKVKVICYFSGGTFENWRSDAALFPDVVKGKALGDWPGEFWLDVSRVDILGPIMASRLDLASAKRCDAVDVDNVDGYANDNGVGLTYESQLAYNKWLAAAAHYRGLGIGLKNNLNQIPDLVHDFDFAVNEQCQQYKECELLTPFIAQNKAVFGIEYKGTLSTICKKASALKIDVLKKRLDLKAWRQACT